MSQENNHKINSIVRDIMEMEPSEVLKYTYQADVDTFLTDYSSMIRDICPDITDAGIMSVLDELTSQMYEKERRRRSSKLISCKEGSKNERL